MPPDQELWESLFDKSANWYDKRPTRNNRPDFVHKNYHFPLWLNDWTPGWAKEQVAEADRRRRVWEKVMHLFTAVNLACRDICIPDSAQAELNMIKAQPHTCFATYW